MIGARNNLSLKQCSLNSQLTATLWYYCMSLNCVHSRYEVNGCESLEKPYEIEDTADMLDGVQRW